MMDEKKVDQWGNIINPNGTVQAVTIPVYSTSLYPMKEVPLILKHNLKGAVLTDKKNMDTNDLPILRKEMGYDPDSKRDCYSAGGEQYQDLGL